MKTQTKSLQGNKAKTIALSVRLQERKLLSSLSILVLLLVLIISNTTGMT